jgi:hypothetical protein
MRSLILASTVALLAGPAVAGPGVNIADGDGTTVIRTGIPLTDGSGRIVRLAREARPFTAIRLDGPAAVEFVAGPTLAIEVEADDNLQDRITTEIDDGVLRIDTRGSFRTRHTPVVRVVAPGLDSLRARGSGDVSIRGIDERTLSIVLVGSSDIMVEGRAADVSAALYGSGVIDLTSVRSPRMAVALYGSGDARVRTDEELSAVVYGSGNIEYAGEPRWLDERVLGTGEIRRLGR